MTTPTPEAIEAALGTLLDDGEIAHPLFVRRLAGALMAAAPFIVSAKTVEGVWTMTDAEFQRSLAHAKAEALQKAAADSRVGPVPYGWNASGVASWLRDRAATIERKAFLAEATGRHPTNQPRHSRTRSSTPQERTMTMLDEIQARADAATAALKAYGRGGSELRAISRLTDSTTDVPKLAAALRAVEAVHQSDGHKQLIGPYCTHCNSPIDGGPEMWPCKTLAAIQRALDG